jgi:hypothetical protein
MKKLKSINGKSMNGKSYQASSAVVVCSAKISSKLIDNRIDQFTWVSWLWKCNSWSNIVHKIYNSERWSDKLFYSFSYVQINQV